MKRAIAVIITILLGAGCASGPRIEASVTPTLLPTQGADITSLPQLETSTPVALLPMRGADISFLPQLEAVGAVFREGGKPKPLLDILKDNGINWIRLRLWVDPSEHGGWCDLTKTVALATRVKQAGFFLLLDIHYSDWWADPGTQNKPRAWSELSPDQLVQRVHDYTAESLQAFLDAGAPPDMVQVGNEITGGMLWPDGRISFSGEFDNPVLMGSWDDWKGVLPMLQVKGGLWQATFPASKGELQFKVVEPAEESWWGDGDRDGVLDDTEGGAANLSIRGDATARVFRLDPVNRLYSFSTEALPDAWDQLASLLEAGLDAIAETLPGTPRMLHITESTNVAKSFTWLEAATKRGLEYEVIGFSYYAIWNDKDLGLLSETLTAVAERYGKDIVLAETSYPWTLAWVNDGDRNIWGKEDQLIPGFPATVEGQKAYLGDLVERMRAIPGGRGVGIFWWEPAGVSVPRFTSSQENNGWFDFGLNFNGTPRVFLGE